MNKSPVRDYKLNILLWQEELKLINIIKKLKIVIIVLTCGLFVVSLCRAGVVYQSPEKMWDTWLFQDGDDYHLFFLSKGGLGRAVSKDIIHWKHLPKIENLAGEDDWDKDGMQKTGCTVKHNDKYYISYGANAKPEGTPIGLLVSDDLVNWKRVGEPVLPIKAPYVSAWRDLSSYWNNNKKEWDGYLFSMFGEEKLPSIVHVTSKDYLNWTYHKPLYVSEHYTRLNNGFVFLEVPDLLEIDGTHYIIFSSIRSRKQFTSGREDASGTWYIKANKKEGPYEVTENPLLLGTGMGRKDHYVGRTIIFKGQRLLYHQNWGDSKYVSWSTPKLLLKDKNNELYLKYWPALDTLKTKLLFEQKSFSIKPDEGWRHEAQGIDIKASDFMLTCGIRIKDAKSFSIFWRMLTHKIKNKKNNRFSLDHKTVKIPPYGLKIEPKKGAFSIVQLEPKLRFNGDTCHTYLKDKYINKELYSEKLQLRLMVRAGRSEIYK